MILPIFMSFVFLPAALPLKCMHNLAVTNAQYDENGFLHGGGTSNITMNTYQCDSALDRCATFASMFVADYMKLDVAAKDSAYTDLIKDNNGMVTGRACMSQKDCATIKAQNADICEGTEGGTASCCCSTDECTGKGVAGMSYALPILAMLTYFVTL